MVPKSQNFMDPIPQTKAITEISQPSEPTEPHDEMLILPDPKEDLQTLSQMDGSGRLGPVEERVETQDSAMMDFGGLNPSQRMISKLTKKVKLSFSKSNQPPATTTDCYRIGKVLGKGAFGKVNLAIHRFSEKFVAIKSINKQFLSEEASKRKVMQEFNILRMTRHNNIVRLYENFESV